MARAAFYAQSGGVTAVINASACGVIETARQHPETFSTVLAGRDGIVGALAENLIDTGMESAARVEALRHTPGGAFGSCRYKLGDLQGQRDEYLRLLEVFAAHDVGYFFYNGGGDSQDATHKVAQFSREFGYPIQAIGIPKTVDNDLPRTDCCPGFGSIAKYVATSIREAAFDVASMAATSTRIFILEVMGRHAGWVAAAGALAQRGPGDAPHLVVMPEVPFERARFMERVARSVEEHGYCAMVVSEGARYADGKFVADAGQVDRFGHTQLGGIAPAISAMINADLGIKNHWAVADYLQRSAAHLASATDVEQAYAVGQHAVELALQGANDVMTTIERLSDSPYRWTVGHAPLASVANTERVLPRAFISADGFGITEACRRYLAPLIMGEATPPYRDGLPDYVTLENHQVPKRLPERST
ncbi:MAG: 6-phosphofructokinase [Pseudomonadota bacterium]